MSTEMLGQNQASEYGSCESRMSAYLMSTGVIVVATDRATTFIDPDGSRVVLLNSSSIESEGK